MSYNWIDSSASAQIKSPSLNLVDVRTLISVGNLPQMELKLGIYALAQNLARTVNNSCCRFITRGFDTQYPNWSTRYGTKFHFIFHTFLFYKYLYLPISSHTKRPSMPGKYWLPIRYIFKNSGQNSIHFVIKMFSNIIQNVPNMKCQSHCHCVLTLSFL